jgi:hypothetical protein
VLTDENGKPSFIQHCGQPTGEKEQVALHQPHGNRVTDRSNDVQPRGLGQCFSRRRLSCSALKIASADPVREDRIHNEAVVGAGPEEQAMSWYYYLEGKICFPFRARCLAANAVSPLRKGEAVELLRMAVEDVCEHDMLVQIRWQGRKMAVPLSQLGAIDPDQSTEEAIGDWHYWVTRGYCL